MNTRFLSLTRHFVALLILSLGVSAPAIALDTVILDRPLSGLDRRNDYAALLLMEVLKRTEPEFGSYKVELAPVYMERKRLLEELKLGQLVNAAAQPSQPSWEANLKTIKVPVDMGLQSWRIALVNQKKQAMLHEIKTLDQLKKLGLGVGSGWSTFGIFQDAAFNVVPGTNYDGLFEMLMVGRSDYFLRGVNEIFIEFDDRKDKNPQLAVEDSFIVHVPLPWLFFTSPKTPRLAKRISAGMEAMLKDGSLQQFMLEHHKSMLVRANLCTRRIFEVPNNNVSAEFLSRKELWFNPIDPKNGLCKGK